MFNSSEFVNGYIISSNQERSERTVMDPYVFRFETIPHKPNVTSILSFKIGCEYPVLKRKPFIICFEQYEAALRMVMHAGDQNAINVVISEILNRERG